MWSETTPMSERVAFIQKTLHRRSTFRLLCQEFGVSEKTGYKWVKRFAEGGIVALADRSHAPRHPAHQVAEAIRQLILTCRRRHPHWGPRKLRAVLQRHDPTTGWPAPSTIGGILRQAGLVGPTRRPRRRPPVAPLPAAPEQPNALWCTDFKGEFLVGNGAWCYPLTLTDSASRFLLSCSALTSTRSVEAWPVFRRAFQRYGLPRAIRSDNGVPFATTALARLSPLAVWWIRLGIRSELIAPGHPEQNGRHERMHKTLKAETARPPAPTLEAQQGRFDRFRARFNQQRPHEALGYTPPAEHYQASDRPLPKRLPALEYAPDCVLRRVMSNGCFRWHSHRVFLSSVLAGQSIGLEEIEDGLWAVSFGPLLVAHFDATTVTLCEKLEWRVSPIIPV